MIDDLMKSLRASLYERTTSPLFGALAMSWALWNYRLFVVLFCPWSPSEKFNYIDNVLYSTLVARACTLIVGPLITAGLFLFVYPFPAKWVYEFWRKQQKLLKDIRQRIENETPLTLEESRRIRHQLVEIQADYERQLKQRSDEIERLKEIVEREQSAYAELQKKSQDSSISQSESDIGRLLSDKEIETVLLNRPFRLFFNPVRGVEASKVVTFGTGGAVLDGRNKNEHSWRTVAGKLEFLEESGKVFSRFEYHPRSQIFMHTNDPDTLSIKGQYMVPERRERTAK